MPFLGMNQIQSNRALSVLSSPPLKKAKHNKGDVLFMLNRSH